MAGNIPILVWLPSETRGKLFWRIAFIICFPERDLLQTMNEILEKNKRLRKELYEKRNEGNSWFIIRGGKVVEVEYPTSGTNGRRGGRIAYRGVVHRRRGRGGCHQGSRDNIAERQDGPGHD